jgi:hypothetical protein
VCGGDGGKFVTAYPCLLSEKYVGRLFFWYSHILVEQYNFFDGWWILRRRPL